MKIKVVVIGAGLAGSLLCNELVKHCDVTLLERGGKNSIQFPSVHFTNKKFAEVNTFCYGGGGTTNLWHNGLMPISVDDITDQTFLQILTESRPFMDRAASALFFEHESYTREYAKLVEEFKSLSNKYSIFPNGIDCLIYPKKYKRLTVDPKVNDIYDVKDMEFIFEGKKIRTVTWYTGSRKYSIDADIVILSAGTIGTPGILQKIAMASNLALSENAGGGLIDHPMGFVGKVKFKKDISGVIEKFSFFDKGDFISRNAVRIKSQCGRYTAGVFFRPALTMGNNLAIYKYKSSLGAGNGRARLKNVFSLKIFHPDIIAEILAHLFGVTIPGRTYNILFIAEQKRGTNRVFYNEAGELKVDWRISKEEISIYQNMLEKLKVMLFGLADEMNIETGISSDWLWSAAHHSGTTPLGEFPADLIDKDLKLRFCDNVFVCDGSVIQEHSYANTGLTIAQLAFRLAEKLGNEYAHR